MKLDALLRYYPNVNAVTLDAYDNVTSFSLAQALPSTTDEAVRRAIDAHVRQEDTASGAVEPPLAQGGDLTKRVRAVCGSLLFGHLTRDAAETSLLNLFNEHVDLNRRAIHPDVEAVLIPEVGPISLGPVVGFVRAGRMFSLAGDPLAPGHTVYTGIAVERPKRKMVDRPQA